MFGPASLSLLALLLIAAVLTRQAPLFLLALALLLASGLSRLYERHCLTGLRYQRRLSRRQAPFGATVELELEIVNEKLLPLAWLEVQEELPRDLPPRQGRVLNRLRPSRPLLHALLALRPFERVRRRYQIPCLRRGEHTFGPALVRTGDLFGLVNRDLTIDTIETLVVFPRVVPLAALGLPAHQPLGDLRARSWLFEDPSRIAGAREYRPGESLRRIHWAATARAQRLQSRVFEATTSHALLLCLNLQTIQSPFVTLEYDPDALELTICAAASIAAWALAQGLAVGLVSNGIHRLSPVPVAVEARADPDHLPRLLEALGRLQPLARQPFTATLAAGARRLPYGATVVAVSAVLTPAIAAALVGLRRRGHPVVLVATGREAPAGPLDGVVVRRIGPPEHWRDLPALAPVAG